MTTTQPIAYQNLNHDPVIHALSTMNGKWDALACVETDDGQVQFKVFNLFERFLALFQFSKDERTKFFDAEAVAKTINGRFSQGGIDFTPEQGNKIQENLQLLAQRLGKKGVNLQPSITYFNRVAEVQAEVAPALPKAWNAQDFSAKLKSFKSELNPYINDSFRIVNQFFHLEQTQVLSLLNQALELFEQGQPHLEALHHEKKYALIQKLDVFVHACEDLALEGIPAARRNLWQNVQALAETLTSSLNEAEYSAYKQTIRLKTIE